MNKWMYLLDFQVSQLGVPGVLSSTLSPWDPGMTLFITEHLVCCSPRAPPAVCGAVRSLMQLVPSLCWITLFLRCLSARRIYGMARLLGDFPLPSTPTCYITPPPSPHPSATLIVCMYIYHPSLSLLPSGESNTGKQECRRCTGWSALVAESSETL